jgi:hypothetical protein
LVHDQAQNRDLSGDENQDNAEDDSSRAAGGTGSMALITWRGVGQQSDVDLVRFLLYRSYGGGGPGVVPSPLELLQAFLYKETTVPTRRISHALLLQHEATN